MYICGANKTWGESSIYILKEVREAKWEDTEKW